MVRRCLKGFLVLLILAGSLSSCGTLKGIQDGPLWDESDVFDPADYPVLTLTSDRPYRILVLADIQLKLNLVRNIRSFKAIRTLVEETDPDLILTVGDNTATIQSPRLTRKLISLMESFGIPWGVVLGNHDSEGSADRHWHGNRYTEAENSLFSPGPDNIQGVGNYLIQLADQKGKVRYGLIMIDSNIERRYPQGKYYDYVYHDQILWYRWVVEGLEAAEGTPVPTMVFLHIPLPEYADAQELLNNPENASGPVFGVQREKVCAPLVNTGFFGVMKELESTTHVFAGHDHINSSSIPWQGIRLTYVLKTGPGSYHDKDLQGGTLVTVDPETFAVTVEHLSLY
jgi:hypothetical protein